MGVGWYYDGSGNEFPLFAPTTEGSRCGDPPDLASVRGEPHCSVGPGDDPVRHVGTGGGVGGHLAGGGDPADRAMGDGVAEPQGPSWPGCEPIGVGADAGG